MIVARHHGELILITQNDHAALAADLLQVWRPLAGHPLRELLLDATRRHDNGWMELDSTPPVDDEGRPHDFVSLPAGMRLEVWDRGTARHLEDRPRQALLIVEHALALHRRAATKGSANQALVELATERRTVLVESIEASGGDAAAIVEAYPWLALADLLSLIACARWPTPRRVEHPAGPDLSVALEIDDRRLRLVLDPFPLAGTTTLGVLARRIGDRRYRNTGELVDALLTATYERLSVRLEPVAS